MKRRTAQFTITQHRKNVSTVKGEPRLPFLFGEFMKPRKGKARVKVTASGKKVSYGQAGKAKGGGPRVRPGTSKGDSYCARSLGIKKRLSKKQQNNPNTPNNLSRKRWKCKGAKSAK